METKKLRIHLGSFDLIKGIAMLLVILGHMSFFYDLQRLPLLRPLVFLLKITGPALMPLFFMISGYGFKEKRVLKTLKTTFFGLIVPYLYVAAAFVAIYPVTYFLCHGGLMETAWVTVRYLLAFLLGIPKAGKVIGGFEVMHCAAVWFFLASFIAFNLLNLIVKIRIKVLQPVTVSVCVIAGYLLILRDINWFCIPQGLMAVGCCYLGLLIKQYDLLNRGIRKVWVYAVLLPVAAAHMYWGHMNLSLGEFRYGLLDYAGACCTAVLFLFAGVACGRREWRGLDSIKQLGMYTYWVLCIHVVEDGCMQWDVFIRAFSNPYIAFLAELLLKGVIITLACVVLKKITQSQYRRRRISGAK